MEWEDIKIGGFIPSQLIERYEGGSYRHGLSINPFEEGADRIYFIHYPNAGNLSWSGRFIMGDVEYSGDTPFRYVGVSINIKEWMEEGNIQIEKVGTRSRGGFWEEDDRCNEAFWFWHIEDRLSSIYVIKNLLSHSFINWTTNPLEVK